MKFTYLATLVLLISGVADTFAAPVTGSQSLSTTRDFAERRLEDRAVVKPKTVKKKKTAVTKRPSAAAAKKPAVKKPAVKKPAVKKTSAAKKATAKKATAKKATAKKTTAKKTTAAAKKPAAAAKKPATPTTSSTKPAASSNAPAANDITIIPVVGVKQSLNSKLWPTEAQMQKSLRPGKDKAWFWSGRVGNANGKDVIGLAQEAAKKAGGATLELTVKKAGFVMSPPGTPQSIWGKASRAFADNVEGVVHVMLGESVRPQSTWNRIEFDALKANPKVTKIIAVHPLSPGEEEVLFTRTGKTARALGLPQKLQASIDEVDWTRLRGGK